MSLAVTWFAVAAFAKWEGVNDHDLPAAIWVVLIPGTAIIGALGLMHFRRTHDEPDREPFDFLSVGWHVFFVITGSLLVLGPLSFLDDDPATKTYIGAPMFLVGLVLVVLFVRHIAKPVRRESETLVQPGDKDTWQPAGAGRAWYVSGEDDPAD